LTKPFLLATLAQQTTVWRALYWGEEFEMKVALTTPPFREAGVVGTTRSMKAVINLVAPLGLAYLAAVLQRESVPVSIIDGSRGLSLPEILDELKGYAPDLVGISCTTPTFKDAIQLAEAVRQTLPKATIVLGGAHVTAIPHEAMLEESFDVGVIGEGEITLLELVREIEDKGGLDQVDLERIEGLAFRGDGQVILSAPRERIKDLDSLPHPARHLLPPLSAYRPTPASYRQLPLAVVMTSRGCPYGCTFCDRGVFGNYVRAHSPERVLDELEELIDRYGAREIRFFDDTFTINRKRVVQISEMILERKLRFPWTCLTRVNTVDKDLLRLMKEAGCWQVLFGLESGDPRMLKLLNKGSSVEQNAQAVKWAQEVGLGVRGDFIIGTPGETMESLENTLSFTKHIKLDYAHFNKFVPYPGTELYERLVAQGYQFDSKNLPPIVDHAAVLYVPDGLSREQVKEFLDRAHRDFYLRPSHIVRRLTRTGSWHELVGQVKGAMAILGL
jgi:anaerobic magnesium-protoporphyrin IX monomethyl ester cyclase